MRGGLSPSRGSGGVLSALDFDSTRGQPGGEGRTPDESHHCRGWGGSRSHHGEPRPPPLAVPSGVTWGTSSAPRPWPALPTMRSDELDYALPETAIAQEGIEPRDQSPARSAKLPLPCGLRPPATTPHNTRNRMRRGDGGQVPLIWWLLGQLALFGRLAGPGQDPFRAAPGPGHDCAGSVFSAAGSPGRGGDRGGGWRRGGGTSREGPALRDRWSHRGGGA